MRLPDETSSRSSQPLDEESFDRTPGLQRRPSQLPQGTQRRPSQLPPGARLSSQLLRNELGCPECMIGTDYNDINNLAEFHGIPFMARHSETVRRNNGLSRLDYEIEHARVILASKELDFRLKVYSRNGVTLNRGQVVGRLFLHRIKTRAPSPSAVAVTTSIDDSP